VLNSDLSTMERTAYSDGQRPGRKTEDDLPAVPRKANADHKGTRSSTAATLSRRIWRAPVEAFHTNG
jgi:hypothetical protein